jgi:dTDP-4-amino-4,6-dideoxygalactose transaminase
MKKAFITGVTGQDRSYLAELLLEKGLCLPSSGQLTDDNIQYICSTIGTFYKKLNQ